MVELAQTVNVKPPLIVRFPKRRVSGMVDKIVGEKLPVVAALAGIISVAGQIVFISLWLSGALDNRAIMAYELTGVKASVNNLGAKMDQLQTRIDNGPSASQMREWDRHLSALDGRLDSNDTRMRQIEETTTRLKALYEVFDKANTAALRGGK